jgi:hypothetical protein
LNRGERRAAATADIVAFAAEFKIGLGIPETRRNAACQPKRSHAKASSAQLGAVRARSPGNFSGLSP